MLSATFVSAGLALTEIGRVEEGTGSCSGVATTAVSRARSRSRRFLGLSAASSGALFLVVTSGAFVRLTGSGLGCENWPRCGDKPYPEQGYHAFVEFGNRMVALVGILLTLATWLAARKVDGLSRIGRGAARRGVPRRRRPDPDGRDRSRRPAPSPS